MPLAVDSNGLVWDTYTMHSGCIYDRESIAKYVKWRLQYSNLKMLHLNSEMDRFKVGQRKLK